MSDIQFINKLSPGQWESMYADIHLNQADQSKDERSFGIFKKLILCQIAYLAIHQYLKLLRRTD